VSLDLQLLLLALEAALYPTLLAAVIILLSQPRPKRLIAVYLAGGLTMSIGAGCAIVYALEQSGTLDGHGSTLSWTADLAIGGLALLLAVALALRADARYRERRRARRAAGREAEPGEDREPWAQRFLARVSTPLVFVAGIAINVPGAAYLVALKDIAADQAGTAQDLARIVVFNAIMFLFAEVPLAGLVFAPERTGELAAAFDKWLSRNGRTIATSLCAALGVFLITRGIIHS
jgi:hypothetical protein